MTLRRVPARPALTSLRRPSHTPARSAQTRADFLDRVATEGVQHRGRPGGPRFGAMTARRVAFEVVRRVFEEEPTPTAPSAAAADGARRARPRVRDAARLRHGPARAHARPRDRDARPPAGAQARPAGARRAPARRLPARLHGRRPAARGRERVGRARPRAPGSSAPSRSRTPSCAGSPRGCRELLAALARGRRRRGGAQALLSRTGSPRPGGASSGRDAALALMRAQNEPPRPSVRARAELPGERDPEIPTALARRPHPAGAGSSEGSPGRRAAAPSSPGSPSAPSPASGSSTSAPRPAARRPSSRGRAEVVAVEKHEGRARELAENAARLGATNVTVVHADALELPAELAGFDRALVDAPCSGLGVLASRPDLRWRAEPLPELQLRAAARGRRARPAGRHDHVLGLHDQRAPRTRRSSTRSASRSTTSAPTGPASATRGDPSSC